MPRSFFKSIGSCFFAAFAASCPGLCFKKEGIPPPLVKGPSSLSSSLLSPCLDKGRHWLSLVFLSLNNTQFSGAVWVGLKVERLGVLQYHMRRLANSSLQSCAARLTGGDLEQLQEVINTIVTKEQPALVQRAEEPEPQPKKLKKEISDSSGFPKCFATTELGIVPFLSTGYGFHM